MKEVVGFAKIVQGADETIELTLEDGEGDPVDVSSATEIKAIFRGVSGTNVEFTDDTEITVTNGREKIAIALSEADTATIRSGERETFEVEATVGSITYIWILKEALQVVERIS